MIHTLFPSESCICLHTHTVYQTQGKSQTHTYAPTPFPSERRGCCKCLHTYTRHRISDRHTPMYPHQFPPKGEAVVNTCTHIPDTGTDTHLCTYTISLQKRGCCKHLHTHTRQGKLHTSDTGSSCFDPCIHHINLFSYGKVST